MNDKERNLYTKQVTDLLRSLYSAVQDAGGHGLSWDFDRMTVNELIAILATNHIRFVYTGHEPVEEPSRLNEFFDERLSGVRGLHTA